MILMHVEEGKADFENCERVTSDGVLDLSSRENTARKESVTEFGEFLGNSSRDKSWEQQDAHHATFC